MDLNIDADIGQVKLGNTILPGIYESIEIEDEAQLDDVEIEGRQKQKKTTQATGYELPRVKVNLQLLNDEVSTAEEKLASIRSLYRSSKQQKKPQRYRIVCAQAQAHGIDEVIFTKVKSRGTNLSDTIYLSLEFMEHEGITIAVQTKTPSSATTNYTVVRGDTLGAIARKFNTTVQALVAANGIVDANKIVVGQQLTIPTGGSSAAPMVASNIADSRSWRDPDIGAKVNMPDSVSPPKLSQLR
jgi:nucleoid-associated protein YgaU